VIDRVKSFLHHNRLLVSADVHGYLDWTGLINSLVYFQVIFRFCLVSCGRLN